MDEYQNMIQYIRQQRVAWFFTVVYLILERMESVRQRLMADGAYRQVIEVNTDAEYYVTVSIHVKRRRRNVEPSRQEGSPNHQGRRGGRAPAPGRPPSPHQDTRGATGDASVLPGYPAVTVGERATVSRRDDPPLQSTQQQVTANPDDDTAAAREAGFTQAAPPQKRPSLRPEIDPMELDRSIDFFGLCTE